MFPSNQDEGSTISGLANMPNCQQEIDIELALRLSSWTKLASSIHGVRCPTCKMVLATRQRKGYVVFGSFLQWSSHWYSLA